MIAMPDDPVTLGELGRRMETGFETLKEDIHELGNRLDKKVSQDLYEIRHKLLADRAEAVEKALSERIDAVERAREADAKQRVVDRRWRIASVAIPVAAIVIAAITAVVIAVVG